MTRRLLAWGVALAVLCAVALPTRLSGGHAATQVASVAGPSTIQAVTPAEEMLRSLPQVHNEPTTTTTVAPAPPPPTSPPRPAPTAASRSAQRPLEASGAVSVEDLDKLGMCESGQDPTEDTGNGYYGAFQFLISTWQSIMVLLGYGHFEDKTYVGEFPRPTDASYEVQRSAAGALIERSGWGQFPGCARKLGKL